MFREMGRRVSATADLYRWLWRAAHASSSHWVAGALRFVGCVLQDTLLLGVWCMNSPLNRPVQRDRVVVPTLAILTVMMLTLKVDAGTPSQPPGAVMIPNQVSAICGGALTLGATRSPGDEIVAFEACADAFTTSSSECESCGPRTPEWGSPFSSENRLAGLSI